MKSARFAALLILASAFSGTLQAQSSGASGVPPDMTDPPAQSTPVEVEITARAAPAAAANPGTYVTTNAAGMTVAIDRQTGKMRPLTADEANRLAQGLGQLVNQSTHGLVEVRHADGSVSMDLQGRFQSVYVARREADGTITQGCVDNVDAAAAFFEIDPALIKAAQTGGQAPSR